MSTVALDETSLDYWRANPAEFIEMFLIDPETGRPFKLLAAEREFLKYALMLGSDGRLLYSEMLFGAIKKSGKTGFGALFMITVLLLFGGRYAEGYAIANDLEQAQSRVFELCRRIIEASPLLEREAKIRDDRITFQATGASIVALASHYTSAAGGHPTIAVFDELWGYTSERARRLYDELVPVPTRKISCRLTVSHAGFEGEGELLHGLYQRGLKLPQIGTDLHAGDGLLMFWSHEPLAPWQTEAWLADMRRTLRPNQYLRMIENRFVTSESNFVEMNAWDRCVDPRIGFALADRSLPVWVGVDASVKHDATAIVAVTFDAKAQLVRLVFHRTFQPTPNAPLDFAATIEATLLDLAKRFQLRKVLFDPYQMQAVSQRLAKAGLPIEEFPQSAPNLTAASQNLYELIQSGGIVAYPDAAVRLAVSRAIAVETARGWRVSKTTAAHKIDVVVALAMACHAAVVGQSEPAPFNTNYDEWMGGGEDDIEAWRRLRTWAYLSSGGAVQLW
jgi:phage terminase large subunit-like protein